MSRFARRVAVVLGLLASWNCSQSPSPAPAAPSTGSAIPVKLTVSGVQDTFTDTAVQWAAKADFSDGSTRDVTGLVTWSTSNPAVATVSFTGLVTPSGVGTAAVKATLIGGSQVVAASASIRVTDRMACTTVSLSLTPSEFGLSGGQATLHVAAPSASCAWMMTLAPSWLSVGYVLALHDIHHDYASPEVWARAGQQLPSWYSPFNRTPGEWGMCQVGMIVMVASHVLLFVRYVMRIQSEAPR